MTIRATFSLPEKVYADLDYLSKRMKISRSALLSQLTSGPLSDLRSMVESVPENPTQGDVRRFRGTSKTLIADRISEFNQQQGGS